MANSKVRNAFNFLVGYGRGGKTQDAVDATPQNLLKKDIVNLPPGRVTEPDYFNNMYWTTPDGKVIANPEFALEIIPVIRKLTMVNPEVGDALDTVVKLTNTGFKLRFDSSVSDDLANEMRSHIHEKSKTWMDGCAGIEASMNKFIAQAYIGGCFSYEAVPKKDLSGLDQIVLLNAEDVRFLYEPKIGRYCPNQKLRHSWVEKYKSQYKPLNNLTYRYFAINGDTANPHGIPPYITALNPIELQHIMMENITHLVTQLGLAGFMEAVSEKPDKYDYESEDEYTLRLGSYLEQFKQRLGVGLNDGIVAGYKGDHEFEFHSTTKNLAEVPKIYNQNQLAVASGLKTSSSLMNIEGGSSETHITVVFTKALSQLKNIHRSLSAVIEHICTLELLMAGYSFKSIYVDFKHSTITDDFKYQQAMEIKIRNLMALFDYGIISSNQFAEAMDYDKPDQLTPRVELTVPGTRQVTSDPGGGNKSAADKKKREDGKNKSDKSSRQKQKTQDRKIN